MGQLPLWRETLHGLNLTIFIRFLCSFFNLHVLSFFEANRTVTRTKLYFFWFVFWFLDPIFAPRPHMANIVHMDPKPPPSSGYVIVYRSSHLTYISKFMLQKYFLSYAPPLTDDSFSNKSEQIR